MALARLPPQRINALDKCTCCVFDGKALDYSVRAGGSTRLISIVANFKRLNSQVAESTRRVKRGKHGRKGHRKDHVCHAAVSILLTVAERGHNHHNDNYVGKCGCGTKRRRGEEDEDGTRFLRRPAASFDPSLIIVVSIELIATLALARRLFDQSRFFNPLFVSPFLSFSLIYSLLYSCTLHECYSPTISRRERCKCNVEPRVSFYSGDLHRARIFSSSRIH